MRQCQGALISLRSATLVNSLLEDCALGEADFQDAQLPRPPREAVRPSRRASVYGATLRGADLRGSILDDLRMRATDLTGATIDSTQLVAVSRTLAARLGIRVREAQEG